MDLRRTGSTAARAVLGVGVAAGLLGGVVGCQPTQTTMSRRLVARMALIDFSGLAPAKPIDGLHVSAAIPRAWQVMPAQHGAMYTHVQWRSPTRATGVGVAVVHMPLPLSAKTILWLAKAKYEQAKADASVKHEIPGGPGRLLAQWTDPVGREWFEVENGRYHVRGYVVTFGFDAWAVYSGYRRTGVPNRIDIELADRSLESVVPEPLAAAVPNAPKKH